MKRSTGADPEWTRLPSLECLQVARHVFDRPSTARFRYRLDDDNYLSPRHVEEAIDLSEDNKDKYPHLVVPGDEIVVKAIMPDGKKQLLFDGFIQGFEGEWGDETEEAVLLGIGVECSLNDSPIPGAVIRQTDMLGAATDNSDVFTDIPGVFNQGGKPNATPNESESDSDTGTDRAHPVFADILFSHPDELQPDFWTLPGAAAYLCWIVNRLETYVRNPKRSELDDVLVAREPIDGKIFDPDDDSTYTTSPLIVSNLPITGRPMLGVLKALIADKGFGYAVQINNDVATGGGDPDELEPVNQIEFRLMQSGALKSMYLQPFGSHLHLNKSNFSAGHISHDLSQAANSWEVVGAMQRIEASFVLQCGYLPAAEDATNPDWLGLYDRNATTFNDDSNRIKYRLYMFGETGDLTYAPVSGVISTPANTDLGALLGEPDGSGKPAYVNRRRPPLGELITRGPDNRPLRAQLSYSRDYAGKTPGIWDGTGTWKPIQGGYELLRDRLGIWISVQNPNHWVVGHDPSTHEPMILKGIESQAVGDPPNLPFALRLTCVIEGDQACRATAAKRDGAMLPRTLSRRVDAGDRYQWWTVAAKSEFNPDDDPIEARDDRDDAQAVAISLRDSTDAGVRDGPITIPYFTMYYRVMDRIMDLNGRDLSLRTNTVKVPDGDDNKEVDATPIYPWIEAIRWDLGPNDQKTTILLSDGNALRQSYRRRGPSQSMSQSPTRSTR